MSGNQNTLHQYIAGELFIAFRQWLNTNGSGRVVLGPVDVRLQEHARLIQPDLFMALGNNWKGDSQVFDGAPDVVVEVLNDSSYRIDRVVKYISYEQVGVKEYWIINPKNQSVEVYALKDKEYDLVNEYTPGETIQSSILQNLSIPVKSIFPQVMQYNGEVSAEALGESVPAQ